MKVYIAGASGEPERVRQAMWMAQAAGLEVTHDWLADIESAGTAHEGLSAEERRSYANADLDAIDRADAVWLLAPDCRSDGSATELGYAIGKGVPVYVSGSQAAVERNIFTSQARCSFSDDVVAIAALLRAECAVCGGTCLGSRAV